VDITDIFRIAESFGYLSKYFKTEPEDQDFLEIPEEAYHGFNDVEKEQKWFTINPKKLNEKILQEKATFVISEKEKWSLLSAFKTLKKYTDGMPEETHFKERLLLVKKQLPPVFFASDDQQEIKEAKIIPFRPKDAISQ
jgi:hypothetical protein